MFIARVSWFFFGNIGHFSSSGHQSCQKHPRRHGTQPWLALVGLGYACHILSIIVCHHGFPHLDEGGKILWPSLAAFPVKTKKAPSIAWCVRVPATANARVPMDRLDVPREGWEDDCVYSGRVNTTFVTNHESGRFVLEFCSVPTGPVAAADRRDALAICNACQALGYNRQN